MAKFRKKPIEVEAVRVAEVIHRSIIAIEWAELPAWFLEAFQLGRVRIRPDFVLIDTLEGVMRGEDLDWIIRGIKGELYPCKPDIFEATYEAVGQ